MAQFARKNKNPIGINLIFIKGRKRPIKIENRDIFETDDPKVIKGLRADEETIEVKIEIEEEIEEEIEKGKD